MSRVNWLYTFQVIYYLVKMLKNALARKIGADTQQRCDILINEDCLVMG
jgi:hypothetical protein